MNDLSFNCPHCKQSLEAPDDMLGMAIDCPACQKQIRIPKKIYLASSKSDSTPSLNSQLPLSRMTQPTSGHMLFACCPGCGKNDIYSICVYCKGFDHFITSGTSVQCTCGTPLSEAIKCPYCQTPIMKNNFSPNVGKQDSFCKNHKNNGIFSNKSTVSFNGKSVAIITGLIFVFILFWQLSSCNGILNGSGDLEITCPKCNVPFQTFTTCANCGAKHAFVKIASAGVPSCSNCKDNFFSNFVHPACGTTIDSSDGGHVRIK